MITLSALEEPVTARPTRVVGTPGIEAGMKETEPSRVEVAVEVSVASSCVWAHRPCPAQGGVQAYTAWYRVKVPAAIGLPFISRTRRVIWLGVPEARRDWVVPEIGST